MGMVEKVEVMEESRFKVKLCEDFRLCNAGMEDFLNFKECISFGDDVVFEVLNELDTLFDRTLTELSLVECGG